MNSDSNDVKLPECRCRSSGEEGEEGREGNSVTSLSKQPNRRRGAVKL